jgi:hypothetical protein
MADQQAASSLVEVALAERQRLVDAKARGPEDDDQAAHPPTVTTLPRLARDRNDLIDRGPIRRAHSFGERASLLPALPDAARERAYRDLRGTPALRFARHSAARALLADVVSDSVNSRRRAFTG